MPKLACLGFSSSPTALSYSIVGRKRFVGKKHLCSQRRLWTRLQKAAECHTSDRVQRFQGRSFASIHGSRTPAELGPPPLQKLHYSGLCIHVYVLRQLETGSWRLTAKNMIWLYTSLLIPTRQPRIMRPAPLYALVSQEAFYS